MQTSGSESGSFGSGAVTASNRPGPGHGAGATGGMGTRSRGSSQGSSGYTRGPERKRRPFDGAGWGSGASDGGTIETSPWVGTGTGTGTSGDHRAASAETVVDTAEGFAWGTRT